MYMEVGLPEDYAKVLGDLDTGIAKHNEEYTNDVIETVTGKRPVTLREFVQANEEVWLNGE